MPHLAICLDLQGKPALVVGGGRVAARKCLALLRSKAEVTVVSPSLKTSLQRLVKAGLVRHLARGYSKGDLSGCAIAFAASDRPEINRQVADEASELRIPVNVADSPESSSFSSPAVIRRGGFSITIATDGEAPALARRVRKKLAASFGREYAKTVALMGKIREKILTQNAKRRYNKQILNELADSPLPELLRDGRLDDVDHLLLELCGPGFSLAELGMRKETTS